MEKSSEEMTIGERIKFVRKEILQKGRIEFAGKINVSQKTLGNWETGKCPLSERNFQEICREFGVNTEWLRTGKGKILQEQTQLEKLSNEYGLDGLVKQVLERYLAFPPEQRIIVADWILKTFDFAEDLKKEISSGKEERRKELQKKISEGKEAQEELEKMEAEGRSALTQDTWKETG